MEENKSINEDEYITINLDGSDVKENSQTTVGRRTAKRNANKKSTRINKNGNKKEKKKWSKKKKLVVFGSILLAIILILGISFGVYVYKAEGNVKEAVKNMASDVAVNIVGKDEPVFVLVLGISEDITSKLTDTIILAGYNPESQKAFMLSIPRDTFVGTNEDTASGWDKINALYQKDIKRTITAVEERTGINIDNYVIVRNTMLSAMVSAIGEVEFDVPIDMDYDDPTQDLHIHLKAGVQMIDGDEAEQLLRFRHNNDGTSYPSSWGDNDYGRMRTQREFIKVVAKHLISVNNVGKLKGIAEAIFANLETNMGIGDIIGYIPYAINFNVDDIRMEQLPGSGAMLNELSFYKASYSRSKTLMKDLVAYLELDEKESKKYYTGKIKQTISSSSDDKTDKCEHDYLSEITTIATCKKEGERTYTCTKCKSSYVESIATTSKHNYNSNGICSVCGADKKQVEHECEYTDLTDTIIEATCTEDGEGTYACEICREKKNLIIKALGHDYDVSGKCTLCGKKKPTSTNNTVGNTIGNTVTNSTNTVAPTVCTHAKTTTATTPATCGTPGSVIVTCDSCKEIVSSTTVPATGAHTAGTPVTTNPTCALAGSVIIKCTGCGHQMSSETLPATGEHTYSNGVCSGCNAKDPNYVADPVPDENQQ